MSRSGTAWPLSHLLTACRLTPSFSPRASWVSPAAFRAAAMRSFHSIKDDLLSFSASRVSKNASFGKHPDLPFVNGEWKRRGKRGGDLKN